MKLSEMQNVEIQKKAKSSYDELAGCSHDELLQKLASEIRSQKEKGVFDYDALKGAIEQMRPYLGADSYENMIRIIENFR